MKFQTISMKQLREDFWSVKEAMEGGQSLLLLYRSRPLAEIKPVRQKILRTVRPRSFSLKQIQQWVKDDQLTTKQQARIDAIINRLP
jgi:antitoxin (DNA-binding transcriptional repressor) of toxin-antitoxin stability system